jgi:hypothetical protein
MSFLANLFKKETDEEKAAAKTSQKLTDDLEKCRKKLKEITDDYVLDLQTPSQLTHVNNMVTINNSRVIIKKQRTVLSDKPYSYDEFISKLETEFEANAYKTKFIEVVKKYIADLVEYYLKYVSVQINLNNKYGNLQATSAECKNTIKDTAKLINEFPELMCSLFNTDDLRINDINNIFPANMYKNADKLFEYTNKFKTILESNKQRILDHLPLLNSTRDKKHVLENYIKKIVENVPQLKNKIEDYRLAQTININYINSAKPFVEKYPNINYDVHIYNYNYGLCNQVQSCLYDKYLAELNDTHTSTAQANVSGGADGDSAGIIQMIVLIVIILAILLLMYIILVETGFITINAKKHTTPDMYR